MMHARLVVPLAAALALVLVACSSDDGGSTPAEDVVEDVAADVGPSDDAERIDVEVPQGARRFRMSVAAPTEGVGTGWYESSWARATTQGDVLTIWMDAGIPWAEVLDPDAPLPAAFETDVATWAEMAADSGLTVMLVIDPLNPDRSGFRSDIYGRDVAGLDAARFGDTTFADAYTEFCLDLLDRLEPTFFSPIVDHNQYGANQPADYEALQTWYSGLFNDANTGRSVAMFPVWDFWQLRATVSTGDELGRQVLRRFDEMQAVFAISLYPALEGVRLANLVEEDFRMIDKDDLAASPVTTRNVAVIGTSFPAEGFTLGGTAYPSSENSQFNFLAFVLGLEDMLTMELVTWRVGVDPDTWIAAPCGDAPAERCDPDAVAERWVPRRANGLYDASNGRRPAGELWEDYAGRALTIGQ